MRWFPFAETLREPGLARLAGATRSWLAERRGVNVKAERRLPALVTVASVYAALCAPSEASARDSDVVARFTLLFFLVDDAALTEPMARAWEPFGFGPELHYRYRS